MGDKSFLPHDGTYFDDLAADEARNARMILNIRRARHGVPAEVREEQIGLFVDVRERPDVELMVHSITVAIGVRALVGHWYERGWIGGVPGVSINPNVPLTQVARVES